MMTHKTFRSAIAIACIATLGACSSMTTREKDTAIGGAAGAIITNSPLGTAAGAAAGGAIGHELSRRRGN